MSWIYSRLGECYSIKHWQREWSWLLKRCVYWAHFRHGAVPNKIKAKVCHVVCATSSAGDALTIICVHSCHTSHLDTCRSPASNSITAAVFVAKQSTRSNGLQCACNYWSPGSVTARNCDQYERMLTQPHTIFHTVTVTQEQTQSVLLSLWATAPPDHQHTPLQRTLL